MTPEQEIRAVAIKAAASFCAPFSDVRGQHIPNVEDVLFVADVFYGYVQGDWEEALKVSTTSDKQEQPAQDVELCEQHQVQDAHSSQPTEADASPSSVKPPTPSEGDAPIADIIPIEARGAVTKRQTKAQAYFNKIKEERATKLLKLATVAKTEEHKERLREDAQEFGLVDFPVSVNGREMELGQYLASL